MAPESKSRTADLVEGISRRIRRASQRLEPVSRAVGRIGTAIERLQGRSEPDGRSLRDNQAILEGDRAARRTEDTGAQSNPGHAPQAAAEATQSAGQALTAQASPADEYVELTLREPGCLFAYWRLSAAYCHAAQAAGGERLALRLYNLTPRANPTVPPMIQRDCQGLSGSVFVDLPSPVATRYAAELGYTNGDGDRWYPLARSAEVAVPPVLGAMPATLPATGITGADVAPRAACGRHSGSLAQPYYVASIDFGAQLPRQSRLGQLQHAKPITEGFGQQAQAWSGSLPTSPN